MIRLCKCSDSYAVFDMNNKISELKGFEIKRRGELEVIKIFQEQVFPKFLIGKSKAEVYGATAEVANRWYVNILIRVYLIISNHCSNRVKIYFYL